ncbi:ornithine decarboxylase 2-like isoform X8 [Leptidea sinapis]|uniref:ornithine decarboxylase 2-like isoform X8 n=1 Tax=Leptidea sinapis TaxID=189913 RepID=UPI0021C482F9|nr:ornithine decarboxylase 2-like isoform X8 [Leptidea sinapis]
MLESRKVFVLKEESSEDVARAMIEGGGQKESFFLLDLDEVYHRIQYFKSRLPRVQIFYAMKANDVEQILKMAVYTGLGFDCASPGEIDKVLQLNVNPLSIIFAVPTKPAHWMTYARDVGVRHTTFDTSYELKKIKQYWSDAQLLIRIKVEGDSIYKLGDKFGCDFETEAIHLLDEAAALNLKVVGVAFHVGSGCSSADSHIIGLQRAKALFDHEEKAGRKMNIVDIGGGFLSDRRDRIDQVSTLVNDALKKLFPDPNIQIIAEPGRYICDSSMDHYSSIINVRRIMKGEQSMNMIYINDGFFGSLGFFDPWHTVKRFETETDCKGNQPETMIIWGPSCDSTDRVMENLDIKLPPCSPLDWLVFPLRGAYTFVYACEFSCLQKSLIRSVISSDLWNKIKGHAVYKSNEFVENPVLSEPLPSTCPPLNHAEWHFNNNTLKS